MITPSLRILRPAWLPWLALAYTSFFASLFLPGLLWSQLHAGPYEFVGRAAFHASLLRRLFILVAILLTLGVGIVLAQAFHEPLHRPFGMLLPSARRRLMIGHIGLTLVLTAAIAVAAHSVEKVPSLIAWLGLEVGALSIWVPLEPGMRWQGSRLAFFTLYGLLILSGFGIWRLQAFMVGHDFTVGVAGFGIAALCFNLGYSRERLRVRAVTPWTTLFSAAGDGAAYARWLQEFQASMNWRSSGSSSIFLVVPADGSTWSWLRLVYREKYPQTRIPQRLLFLFIPVVMFLLFMGIGYQFATVDDLQHPLTTSPGLMGGALPSIYMLFFWPNNFYPISRRERFRIVAVWSLAQELYFLMLLLLAVCGQRMGEMLAGVHRANGLLDINVVLLFVLTLTPFLLWAGLCRSRRQMGRSIAIFIFVWIGFVAAIPAEHSRILALVFSPIGLVVMVALIIVLHVAYFAYLRRICLKADLVLRSA